MSEIVGLAQIREVLAGTGKEALSEMAITNFVAEGMPKLARGRYDAFVCLRWYVGRLRTAVQQKKVEGADGKQISLDEADIRLKTAKAESEEMTLAERRGELMPIHLHESMLTHLVQITKQRILNIPARLGPKLQDCTAIEIKALLSAALRDALT